MNLINKSHFVLVFMSLLTWRMVISSLGVDVSRYEEGKHQYQMIQQHAKMPLYGTCWQDAMETINKGCRRLTDQSQTRLALAYLNCFLELQGQPRYPCDDHQDLQDCLGGLRDSDRSSLTTFFTHTQSICYFLQAQIWQAQTENTVERLAHKSSLVADQLEGSLELQEAMMVIQNRTLATQDQLLTQAGNLSREISDSSHSVHRLFQDLKKSTSEQTELMNNVFDQMNRLQNTILGEVSGLYSFFYYVMSVMVCYLLTSTQRTAGARMWLFLIMTVNFILEQTMMRGLVPVMARMGECQDNSCLYWLQKCCRSMSMVGALTTLCACAWMFRDINAVNNQLLVEIRKQNSDIRKLISGGADVPDGVKSKLSVSLHGDGGADVPDGDSDSNYSSDDNASEASSDATFVMPDGCEDWPQDENASFCTINDSASNLSILSELNDLREATPLRELGQGIHQWLNDCKEDTKACADKDLASLSTPKKHSYNLRIRTPTSKTSPATKVESPRSFHRTVRHMQQITEKNSQMLRACLNNQDGQAE